MEEKISDLTTYNNSMRRAMRDKLFFLSHIEAENYLDYGCGDGSLLYSIVQEFPDSYPIGYDINPDMLSLAREKFSTLNYGFISDRWSNCMRLAKERTALILSSVIHEIYSYGTDQEIKIFWDRVFNSEFKYICIRDMFLPHHLLRSTPSNTSDVMKIKSITSAEKLESFVQNSGTLFNKKNLIHFLMKYRWDANWDREVQENYFPLSTEQFLSIIPYNKYKIIYYHEFAVPYTVNKIKEDFNIDLQETTHVKCILERIN